MRKPGRVPPDTHVESVRQVRAMLVHFVPVEVADIILRLAEYYAAFTVSMDERQTVKSGRALIARSVVLTQEKLAALEKVRVVIAGHDQGPTYFGRHRGIWTWYTMNACVNLTTSSAGHLRLATNEHPLMETQTYSFEWTCEDIVVQELVQGQQICLWAHARAPGGVNVVEYAEITFLCFPRAE